MTKICTTIEQSKKLIELGIDVITADMCWTNHLFNSFLSSWRVESTPPQEYKNLLDRFVVKGYLIEPAWSSDALSKFLPPYLFEFERGIDLNIYPNLNGKGWHCSYMPNCIENMKKDKFKQITNGDTIIDAMFEMVCYLLENKMI